VFITTSAPSIEAAESLLRMAATWGCEGLQAVPKVVASRQTDGQC
jgi:hypothetical protein